MAIFKPFRQVQQIKRKDLNHDLVDYVCLPGCFNAAEVQAIRALWNDADAEDSRVNVSGVAKDYNELRKSRVMFIDALKENKLIYNRLAEACLQVNMNRFKFDLTGFQTKLQLATYGPEDFFEWHMDYGVGDVSNRKLSITVQLSDPADYADGDLQFMINHQAFSAPKEAGTAIIFPSYAMHRVLPVASGRRQSIVGWIGGAPFR